MRGLLMLWVVLATGCGPNQQELLVAKRSVDDRLQSYVTVLADLRGHPEAEKTRAEMERAAGWIRRAEALSVDPKQAVGRRMDLLLDVIDGQLVRVKTELARIDAQVRLEAQRSGYEKTMNRMDGIRRENTRLREGDPR